MPKVTIWIRNEDYDFWKQIEKKPDFIHDAIRVQRNMFGGSAEAMKLEEQKMKLREIHRTFDTMRSEGKSYDAGKLYLDSFGEDILPSFIKDKLLEQWQQIEDGSWNRLHN